MALDNITYEAPSPGVGHLIRFRSQYADSGYLYLNHFVKPTSQAGEADLHSYQSAQEFYEAFQRDYVDLEVVSIEESMLLKIIDS
jgi:hypothetical protein